MVRLIKRGAFEEIFDIQHVTWYSMTVSRSNDRPTRPAWLCVTNLRSFAAVAALHMRCALIDTAAAISSR